jgi:hypothetical protein
MGFGKRQKGEREGHEVLRFIATYDHRHTSCRYSGILYGGWGVMMFRQQDADIFGTSEWVLVADDGHETPISILDLRSEGFGFVINRDNDEWGTADTGSTYEQLPSNARSRACEILASVN